jgi:hypothetical protein
MDALKIRAMILASGNYLTANFPDDWFKWEEEELDQFMWNNAWEPLEDFSPDWVYEQIEQSADTMVKFVKENQNGS